MMCVCVQADVRSCPFFSYPDSEYVFVPYDIFLILVSKFLGLPRNLKWGGAHLHCLEVVCCARRRQFRMIAVAGPASPTRQHVRSLGTEGPGPGQRGVCEGGRFRGSARARTKHLVLVEGSGG